MSSHGAWRIQVPLLLVFPHRGLDDSQVSFWVRRLLLLDGWVHQSFVVLRYPRFALGVRLKSIYHLELPSKALAMIIVDSTHNISVNTTQYLTSSFFAFSQRSLNYCSSSTEKPISDFAFSIALMNLLCEIGFPWLLWNTRWKKVSNISFAFSLCWSIESSCFSS